MRIPCLLPLVSLLGLLLPGPASAQTPFTLEDVFQLQYAQDPQISPDGSTIAYSRTSASIKTDQFSNSIWLIRSDGSEHYAITRDKGSYSSARWSPDGSQLAVVASEGGEHHILLRTPGRKKLKTLVTLDKAARSLSWSPDGSLIAFSSFVPVDPEPFVTLPSPPEGASWAEPARVIDKMIYRRDGSGYVKPGNRQLFIVAVADGQPRQLTSAAYDHGGPLSWTADGKSLLFSGQLYDEWEYSPRNSNIYQLDVEGGDLRQLTDRNGPEDQPTVSPDGKLVAFIGFVDDKRSYQPSDLYVMAIDGSQVLCLTSELDRSVTAPRWSSDGGGLFFKYDDHGVGKIGSVSLDATLQLQLVTNVGGTSLGRPYQGGSYSVSRDGSIAFTQSQPDYPAEVAIVPPAAKTATRLTRLNAELFADRTLARTEHMVFKSSFDDREIDAWVVTPPNFDPAIKYPLILEIHGGPFANYGSRFAMEIQLYAAAGYVVVYTNPRGSTGYGEAFTDLIDHNYPCEGDFQDLMSGVDAIIARGSIDPGRLFVTGGSGGGILTAWVVGKTGRFAAAVAQKPVINWYSFVLTSDGYNYFSDYWFSGPPWQTAQTPDYLARSPLSLVGNVTTPTMLLTGEQDYRTPMSESEQFYQALRLRKVDSMLIRIPGASHAIVARPSRMMVKVAHILKWFERYDSSRP
jgi:acylaminoacyl-peptidase